MADPMILNCPFCHHKEEYHDAPPGSTVRCHECECIFRVPTLRQRKAGKVVTGEAIRRGAGKWVVLLIVLALLAGTAGAGWYLWLKPNPVAKDPFEKIEDLWPVSSPHGVLQRFLESWKMGDLQLMLEFCLPSSLPGREDKEFEDWLQSMFGNVRLIDYTIEGVKELKLGVYEYRVILEGEDSRTKVKLKGRMCPRVSSERIDEDEVRWGVEIRTAAPSWE